MAAPVTTWALTEIAHPEVRDFRPACQGCLRLAQSAITTAWVTGSVGATHIEGEHSAKVARVTALYTSGPDGIAPITEEGRA